MGKSNWRHIGFIDSRGVYIHGDQIGIEEDYRYLREPTEEELALADKLAEIDARCSTSEQPTRVVSTP